MNPYYEQLVQSAVFKITETNENRAALNIIRNKPIDQRVDWKTSFL